MYKDRWKCAKFEVIKWSLEHKNGGNKLEHLFRLFRVN